ncbi:MAG: hypothetical protein HXX18_12475 [Bacteroidetes bacterium]|nr:hypothetical protein [Bacteroidota bacterium]
MRSKILFFLILLSANVLAQKIDEEQVPKDVLIGLETIYPEVKAKSWELKEGNYFANIKVDGQSGKAEITPNGKWIISKFPVGEKELPSTIVKFFYDNYIGYKITISQYIEEPNDNNYYYLKIQKKGLNQEENGELFFDLSGKLTKNTAPEIVKANTEIAKNEVAEEEKPVKNKKKKIEVIEEEKPVKSSKKKTEIVEEEKPVKSSKKKTEVVEEDKPVKSSKKKVEVDDSEEPVKKAKPEKTVATTKPKPEPKVKAEKPAKEKKKKEEDEDVSSSSNVDVPVVVKKYFDKKFPRSEEVIWSQKDSNFISEFFFHEMEQKAEFAPDGKMVSTTTIMDPKNIFRPLENYLIKKYDKYKVVKAEKTLYDRTYQKLFPEKKLKNYYYVEISQKVKGSKIPKITKLWFDGVGAIDHIEEGDIEDDSGYNNEEKVGKHDRSFEEKVGDK